MQEAPPCDGSFQPSISLQLLAVSGLYACPAFFVRADLAANFRPTFGPLALLRVLMRKAHARESLIAAVRPWRQRSAD
jgi:hypothetical protein